MFLNTDCALVQNILEKKRKKITLMSLNQHRKNDKTKESPGMST